MKGWLYKWQDDIPVLRSDGEMGTVSMWPTTTRCLELEISQNKFKHNISVCRLLWQSAIDVACFLQITWHKMELISFGSHLKMASWKVNDNASLSAHSHIHTQLFVVCLTYDIICHNADVFPVMWPAVAGEHAQGPTRRWRIMSPNGM